MAVNIARDYDKCFLRGSSLIHATAYTPITVQAWLQYTVQTNGKDMTVYNHNGPNDTRFCPGLELYAASSDTKLRTYQNGATKSSAAFETGGVDTWFHCVWQHAADTTLKMWANGVEVYSDTHALGGSSADQSLIGAWSSGDTWAIDIISEFAVWNAFLSSDEIVALANRAPVMRTRRSSLVSYVPFNDGSGVDLVLGEVWSVVTNPPSIVDHPPVAPPFGWDFGWQGIGAGAEPPPGISIPVAMHHYTKNIRSA